MKKINKKLEQIRPNDGLIHSVCDVCGKEFIDTPFGVMFDFLSDKKKTCSQECLDKLPKTKFPENKD